MRGRENPLVPEDSLHQQVFGEEIKYSNERKKYLSLIRSLLGSYGSNVGSFETPAAIKEKDLQKFHKERKKQ